MPPQSGRPSVRHRKGAEVIGAAIALNLLFGLPLAWGVSLTALDVIIVLYLQHRGFRYVEALVVGLILAIAGSFAVELWLARPDLPGVALGFMPHAAVVTEINALLAGNPSRGAVTPSALARAAVSSRRRSGAAAV